MISPLYALLLDWKPDHTFIYVLLNMFFAMSMLPLDMYPTI